MRPKKPKTTEEGDLFRARLDQIINIKHELAGREGDAANVILTAVGHNLRRILAWLRDLLRLILLALWRAFAPVPAVRWAS